MIKGLSEDTEYMWVQEEPRNMGPWNYILRVVDEVNLKVVCRKPSPSPATGYYKQHADIQNAIVEEAFSFVEEKALVKK